MKFCNFLVETRPKAKEQVFVVCLFNCCIFMFYMINIAIQK